MKIFSCAFATDRAFGNPKYRSEYYNHRMGDAGIGWRCAPGGVRHCDKG